MGQTMWGIDVDHWKRLRANSEIDVRISGGPGVRLSGGPLDTWLVKPDADQLAIGWYATWPASLRRGRPAGYYRLSQTGNRAVWTPALEPNST